MNLRELKASKSFGFLVRSSAKVDGGILEARFGIQRVRTPVESVTAAVTRRKRHGMTMRTELVLIGDGAELGVVELSALNLKSGEEMAQWINDLLRANRP